MANKLDYSKTIGKNLSYTYTVKVNYLNKAVTENEFKYCSTNKPVRQTAGFSQFFANISSIN